MQGNSRYADYSIISKTRMLLFTLGDCISIGWLEGQLRART